MCKRLVVFFALVVVFTANVFADEPNIAAGVTAADCTYEVLTTPPNPTYRTVRLKARWKLETYSITYDLNDGSWPNNPVNPATYNIETKTFTISSPARPGYTFIGWCEDTNLSVNCAVTKTITQGSTGNRSFYAKWQKDAYDIYYVCDVDGVEGRVIGTDEEYVLRSGAAQYPSTYSFEPVDSVCKAENYVPRSWNCWYDADDEMVPVSDGDDVVPYGVECDAVYDGLVKLHWEPSNDETIETPNMCTLGGTMTNIQQPTKTGYTFKGWKLSGCLIPKTDLFECLASNPDICNPINVSARVARNLNGNIYSDGGATWGTYGIEVPELGKWAATLRNGNKVEGMSLCSSTSGTLYDAGNPDTSGTGGTDYCWCKVTRYISSDSIYQCQLVFPNWVLFEETQGLCDSTCATKCAFIGSGGNGYNRFREALFRDNMVSQ